MHRSFDGTLSSGFKGIADVDYEGSLDGWRRDPFMLFLRGRREDGETTFGVGRLVEEGEPAGGVFVGADALGAV